MQEINLKLLLTEMFLNNLNKCNLKRIKHGKKLQKIY